MQRQKDKMNEERVGNIYVKQNKHRVQERPGGGKKGRQRRRETSEHTEYRKGQEGVKKGRQRRRETSEHTEYRKGQEGVKKGDREDERRQNTQSTGKVRRG